MNIEFEAKFIVEVDEFKEKIERAGAHLVTAKKKMRRYNFGIGNDENSWLRVRDEGDKITFTYKSFDKRKGIESVKELEVVVNDFDTMCSMVKILGYKELMYCENYREIWKIDDCFIMIDYWPALPPVAEVEGFNKESVQAAVEKIALDMNDALYGPTGQLYEKIYGLSLDQLKTIKKLTFDDIPEELQKVVK